MMSSLVMFMYYAILVAVDIYCFKVPEGRTRSKSIGYRATRVLSMTFGTLVGAAVLAGIYVLFGAPLQTQQDETLAAALDVSLLAITPAVVTLKSDLSAWRRALLSFEEKSLPEQWAAGFFWSSMVTSWAAAYFVPMDWDRPWQRWPIPIVGGAYVGYLIGLLYVLVRCFVLPIARADFKATEEEKLKIIREMTARDQQKKKE
ncbi:Glycosylphosphatidylinositol (GPI) anchor assembly protein [Linderina pennispora]|nr:Glycosylphosphatidylinositol (GPI) anchor assembly protein [Linderina pennispora]